MSLGEAGWWVLGFPYFWNFLWVHNYFKNKGKTGWIWPGHSLADSPSLEKRASFFHFHFKNIPEEDWLSCLWSCASPYDQSLWIKKQGHVIGSDIGWRRSWSPKRTKGCRLDKSIYVHYNGYLKSLKVRKYGLAWCRMKTRNPNNHKELKMLCSSWSHMASCLFSVHLFSSFTYSSVWFPLLPLTVVATQALCSYILPIKMLILLFCLHFTLCWRLLKVSNLLPFHFVESVFYFHGVIFLA